MTILVVGMWVRMENMPGRSCESVLVSSNRSCPSSVPRLVGTRWTINVSRTASASWEISAMLVRRLKTLIIWRRKILNRILHKVRGLDGQCWSRCPLHISKYCDIIIVFMFIFSCKHVLMAVPCSTAGRSCLQPRPHIATVLIAWSAAAKIATFVG